MVAIAIVIPFGILAVRKYLYLSNEPTVRTAIDQGDFHRAMELLKDIPAVNLQSVDTAVSAHLRETLSSLSASNAALEADVATLKATAQRRLRLSSQNLEDRLRAATESGGQEEYAMALLEQLARSYGMKVTRE